MVPYKMNREISESHLLNLDHHMAITEAIREVCNTNAFCDCTLYCSDGFSVKAHRAILSASSPFLKNIIQTHSLSEPEIFLPGVSKTEILAFIEFIYTGEATVPIDFLETFFETCKELQIVHLKEYEVKNEYAINIDNELNLLEVSDLPTLDIETKCAIDENIIENYSPPMDILLDDDVDWSDEINRENMDSELELNKPGSRKDKMIYSKEDIGFVRDFGPTSLRRYQCKKCGKRYSHRRTLLHHIHWICGQPATYACTQCSYKGKRKFQLRSHVEHVHLFVKKKNRSLLKANTINSHQSPS